MTIRKAIQDVNVVSIQFQDGTIQTTAGGGGGGGITALTGDVLAGPGSGSQAATIPAFTVQNLQMALMAAQTFKANVTGGSSPPQDVSVSQMRTALGVQPAALSLLPTATGAPQFPTAAGFLLDSNGFQINCARTLAGYVNGNDGLLYSIAGGKVRVEANGLLVESASTNLVTNSVVNASSWSNNFTTLASNVTTAPDGTTTATRLTAQAGTHAYFVFQTMGSTLTNGQTYTYSCYLKANTVNFACLSMGNTGNARATINLSTGAVTSVLGIATSAKAVALANGWYRLSVTWTENNGADQFPIIAFADTEAHAHDANFATAWTAAGTESIYCWGAQVEKLPWASSYIVTTSATVTRDADILTCFLPLSATNPSTWTAALTATPIDTWANVAAAVPSCRLLSAGASGGANSFRMLASSGTAATWDIFDSAAGQKSLAQAAAMSGSSPVNFTFSNAAGTLTGTPGSTSTSGAGTGTIAAQPNFLTLGGQFGSTTLNFNGWLKNVLLNF